MYQKTIVGLLLCTAVEACAVEACMRAECGTLDGLSVADFRRLALQCLEAVRLDPAMGAALAASYGLKVPEIP